MCPTAPTAIGLGPEIYLGMAGPVDTDKVLQIIDFVPRASGMGVEEQIVASGGGYRGVSEDRSQAPQIRKHYPHTVGSGKF